MRIGCYRSTVWSTTGASHDASERFLFHHYCHEPTKSVDLSVTFEVMLHDLCEIDRCLSTSTSSGYLKCRCLIEPASVLAQGRILLQRENDTIQKPPDGRGNT